MEPGYIKAMMRLLAYSWEDAEFEYEGLTDRERELVSKGEFEEILREMAVRGVVQLGLEEA